jgi:hypothetical protein
VRLQQTPAKIAENVVQKQAVVAEFAYQHGGYELLARETIHSLSPLWV